METEEKLTEVSLVDNPVDSDYEGKPISIDAIFAEKIRSLYTGSAYRPLWHIIPAGFMLLLTYGYIDLLVSLIWLLIVFAINVMRYLDIRQMQAVLEEQVDFIALRNRFARYVLVLGVMYGLGAVYASANISITSQLMLLSMMATMMPAAIISFAYDRKTFFSFFLPILVPIVIQQLWWGHLLNLYIALLAAIYIAIIMVYFYWHRGILVDAICHRIASAQHINQLVNTNKALEKLSSTDTLTGIGSRRLFDFTLDREWRRMKRNRTDLSLMFVDIDDFDHYKAKYGNDAANKNLRLIARTIFKSCSRPLDMVVRFDKDKFAVLLPDTTMENSVIVARKIRFAIERLDIENKITEGKTMLTVSIGIASSELRRVHNDVDLVTFANESLELARKSGGNSIITSGTFNG